MTVSEARIYLNDLVQTHRFFQNYIELNLVYAIHYFESGEIDKANELAAKTKAMAEAKKHPVKAEWIAAAHSILDGKPKLNELLSLERHYSFK